MSSPPAPPLPNGASLAHERQGPCLIRQSVLLALRRQGPPAFASLTTVMTAFSALRAYIKCAPRRETTNASLTRTPTIPTLVYLTLVALHHARCQLPGESFLFMSFIHWQIN